MKTTKLIACLVLLLFPFAACNSSNTPSDLATIPTPDLVVKDIEVSQGTQDLSNTMPLVANRWTLVRVLVDDQNDAGAENVTARLLGFRICPGPGCPADFNGPLPLPTLNPWNPGGRISLSKEGGSRVNLNDGFWFFLPKSWREFPGQIQITAQINPDGAVNETLEDNNTKAVAVSFNAADMLRVRAVPLHLHQGWDKDNPEVIYDCSETDFWDIFLNMFRYHPIDRFLVTCPSEALEPFPHDVVPKEIAPFEWDMSDPDICGNANVRLHWLKAQENLEGRWQYAGLIHPLLGGLCNGWSGAANGDAVWLRMRSTTGSEPWIISSGVTLAHELGHSHLPNPDHILCKGNEGPPNGSADTNYPYIFPNCRFSASSARGYYGLDVYYALWPGTAAAPAVLPNGNPNAMVSDPELFPLMGYLSPRWTDPYTYCTLLNSYVLSQNFFCDRDTIDVNPDADIINNKLDKASIPPETDLLNAAEWVLVSGNIDFETPTASAFNQISRQAQSGFFGHVADDAVKRLRAQQAAGQTGRFQLEVRNATNAPLYTLPIVIEENHHEVPVKSDSFFELLAFPVGATSIALVDSKDGAVLAQKTPSPQSPSVTFTEPAPGTTLGLGTIIAWQGRDADADILSYTLRYSPNGGLNWHVIALDTGSDDPAATQVTGSHTLQSVDRLPGSTAGLLELVVNDGFNTSTTRFSGSVVIPGKPPQIVMQGGRDQRTLKRDSPLILSATVLDIEDGVITEPASLTWRSDQTSALLGTGPELILQPGMLATGMHRMTLQATDSDGMQATRSIDVFVSESAGI